MWEFTWRVSDCEELVGVTRRKRCWFWSHFTWMVVNMDFIVEELVGPETSSLNLAWLCADQVR